MLRTMLAIAVLFALLVGSAMAGNAKPKQMVLTLQNMPTGFSVQSTGVKSASAAVKEGGVTLAELKKWGYVTAYETDFTRDVSLSDLVKGAIDVESSVSVYGSKNGAQQSLASSDLACNKPPATELSVGAKIGDEAHLCALVKKSGTLTVQSYVVLWRHGKLKGAVIVAGIQGGVSPDQAVQLAEIQDKLMG